MPEEVLDLLDEPVAPIVTARRTPSLCNASTSSLVKLRHPWCGSSPSTTTRSRSKLRTANRSLRGQVIARKLPAPSPATGAAHLEVEVVVGVDHRRQLGIGVVEERRRRQAGRLPGVAPTFECHRRNGVLEDRRVKPFRGSCYPNLRPQAAEAAAAALNPRSAGSGSAATR